MCSIISIYTAPKLRDITLPCMYTVCTVQLGCIRHVTTLYNVPNFGIRSVTVKVFYIVQDKETHVLGLVHWKYRDITFRILWNVIKIHIDPLLISLWQQKPFQCKRMINENTFVMLMVMTRLRFILHARYGCDKIKFTVKTSYQLWPVQFLQKSQLR